MQYLVMHFHIFHDTKLWEGLGRDLIILKNGTFSILCPSKYQSIPILNIKYPCAALEKTFFSFLCKNFLQNLSSMLSEILNFHII